MLISGPFIPLRPRVMSTTPFPSKKARRDQGWFVAFVGLAQGESCPIYLNAGYVIAILVLCGPRLEGDSKNLLPTIAQMHKTPKAPNHRSTKTVVVANDQADGGSTAADFRRESRSPTISNLRRSSSRMTPVSLAC